MLVEIIQQQHRDLQELFARHQEALLKAEFDNATLWLKHFITCQQSHMHIEERYLFPAFEKIERKSKWDVSLYEKEHKKINQFCEKISEDINWLIDQDLNESQLRRNIIAVLDKEKTLKGLNEHHEDREEEAMLKELDEQLDELHLREILLDIKMTWAEVMGAVRESIS